MAEADDPDGSAKPPAWPVVDKSSPYAFPPEAPTPVTGAPYSGQSGHVSHTATPPQAAASRVRWWLVVLGAVLAASLAFVVGVGLGALLAWLR